MLAGAAASWGASGLVWVEQRWRTPFTGDQDFPVAGAAARPELVPVALATLAAVAAVLATSGILRRLMGLLVVAAGAVLAWRTVSWFADGTASSRDVPAGSTPLGSAQLPVYGPLLVLVAAALLLVAGLWVLVAAHRMAGMGARYDAPGSSARAEGDPDKRWWDALDSGEDPTDERAGGTEDDRRG
ncbi:hypothetical protein GIY23_16070 [Allosaccharopolyspora coralli]|uniref:Trp biosynthesis-associated membrane protein n=1 Tax=Allosaccharopolyspora coralli TaxID=2665642 RepID=A0A5Q3QG33_9PSEU|nr:Trp biosynthesis-associated membrane protein [Allosaccharopolyspora coralli]QGK72336.1 hypothetical protein GIY23_16070 [Allosaccharopolyspora coralli]